MVFSTYSANFAENYHSAESACPEGSNGRSGEAVIDPQKRGGLVGENVYREHQALHPSSISRAKNRVAPFSDSRARLTEALGLRCNAQIGAFDGAKSELVAYVS